MAAESFFLVIVTHGGDRRHLTSKCESVTNGGQYLRPRTKTSVGITFGLRWKSWMVPILMSRDLNQGGARRPWRLSDAGGLGARSKEVIFCRVTGYTGPRKL